MLLVERCGDPRWLHDGRNRAAYGVAFVAPAAPEPPRALLLEDLEFGRDLVALRVDAQGQPRPESPSSLETLMVSRLAWLLSGTGPFAATG